MCTNFLTRYKHGAMINQQLENFSRLLVAASVDLTAKQLVQVKQLSTQITRTPFTMNDSNQPQMLTEEDIARNKLLYDGEGLGDDKRINQIMKYVCLSQNENNDEEQDSIRNRILNLLAEAEVQCIKYKNIHATSLKEYDYYEDLTNQLNSSIENKRLQIQHIKTDLNKAKIIRKNRMEYDPLVDKILNYPSREQSLEKIAKIKRDTETLEKYREDFAKRLEMRKQELDELATLAKSVYEKLVEDESLNVEELADDPVPETNR